MSQFLAAFLIFVFPLSFFQVPLPSSEYDLAIINARIVDGSGNPWFRGGIGIKNGKIVKIGNLDPSKAAKVIDAQNNIVAPGFIDVHTHVEDIYEMPKAENFIRMGVTSLITGNCGTSAPDIKNFLEKIKTAPLAVNIGTLIAHGTVRARVMGLDNREANSADQAKMNEMVEQGMKDGALGLSTGLIYVPGTFSKTEEIVELARVASKYDGIYATHMRDEGTDVVKAIEESIKIGDLAGIPVEISHFKITSKRLWGESDVTIGLVKSARERGLSVTVDQYVYTASSTSLDARMPNWSVAGGREEGKKRLADPVIREKIAEEMKEELKKKKFKDFSFAYVASYRPNPEFNGKNIAEIAKSVKGSKKLKAQIEQIFDMYEKGGASMVYHVIGEEDIQNILRQPFTMIASDSGARRFGQGVPHPRGYGNNARVLGKYVREMKLISIEDAIRKMTSLPAQTFGIRDRGQLREGMAADIVIFDEKLVGDKASYESPHQYPMGFNGVIVNGEVVFDGKEFTGKMPGRAIYRKSSD